MITVIAIIVGALAVGLLWTIQHFSNRTDDLERRIDVRTNLVRPYSYREYEFNKMKRERDEWKQKFEELKSFRDKMSGWNLDIDGDKDGDEII